MLRRNSTPATTNSYYSSFDNSVHSNGNTLPTPTSFGPAGGGFGILDDSSDHEREDDNDSVCGGVFDGRSNSGSAVQLLGDTEKAHKNGLVGLGDCRGRLEYSKEDILREGGVMRPSPYTLTCTLIPSWAVQHCEFSKHS